MPEKKRSGYYYFMLNFRKTEERKGRSVSLEEIRNQGRCQREWEALSAGEKKRYINMGKSKRNGGNPEEKLTGIGESLKLVEKQQRERSEYESRMKEYTNNIIDRAINFNDLGDTPFYFIHTNWYYTKTNVEDNSVDYIPAEFAVVEFTLGNGVKRIYHEIIKVSIETGYAREAMEHSDMTHKIDVYRNAPITNFRDLYTRLYDFLSSQNKSNQKLPILYTTRKVENVVRSLLRRMVEAAGVPHSTYDLYSLEYLFGTLMMHLNDNFPRDSNRACLAEAELDRDAFIYTPNIECSYHRIIEGTSVHCSQSVVIQWGYALCDYCCELLGIEMRSGIHRPYRVDEEIASGIQALNIKKIEKPSTIKSETGVSEAHRLKVSVRSRKEEELRKKQGKDILVIDHGEINNKLKESTVIPSTASSSSSSRSSDSPTVQSLRPPSSVSEVFKSTPVPLFNDDNEFPALDEGRKQRPFKKS